MCHLQMLLQVGNRGTTTKNNTEPVPPSISCLITIYRNTSLIYVYNILAYFAILPWRLYALFQYLST